MQDPKNWHLGTIAQLCWAISSQLRQVSTIGKKKLVKQQCLPLSPIFPHNMVNFCLLAAEICWRVWGTPANFNGFRILAVLLHGTLVVGVSQTLQRSTEGATYIRQGGHHVRHWPMFLVLMISSFVLTLHQCVTDSGLADRLSELLYQWHAVHVCIAVLCWNVIKFNVATGWLTHFRPENGHCVWLWQ